MNPMVRQRKAPKSSAGIMLGGFVLFILVTVLVLGILELTNTINIFPNTANVDGSTTAPPAVDPGAAKDDQKASKTTEEEKKDAEKVVDDAKKSTASTPAAPSKPTPAAEKTPAPKVEKKEKKILSVVVTGRGGEANKSGGYLLSLAAPLAGIPEQVVAKEFSTDKPLLPYFAKVNSTATVEAFDKAVSNGEVTVFSRDDDNFSLSSFNVEIFYAGGSSKYGLHRDDVNKKVTEARESLRLVKK